MNCDEVQPLCGLSLDSELEPKTSLQIEEHLKGCPACSRLFSEEHNRESRLRAGLKQGERTAALWDRLEKSVAAVAARSGHRADAAVVPKLPGWQRVLAALGEQVQAGWRRSRWAWCGLAAAWAGILVLNFAAREPGAPLLARAKVPSPSEVRLAWEQKQMMMADLAGMSESAPPAKLKAAPPRPHSERRRDSANT